MTLESIINFLSTKEVLTGIFGIIGGSITGFVSYKLAKMKSKKSDRQLLSQDEQKFRDDLYERMKVLEIQVDKLRKQVDQYHSKSIELEEEVMQWKNKYVELDKEWRFKYTELEMENKHLQNKVFVLESHLRKIHDKNE